MKRTGLVADAGGTNIRFALIDLDRPSGGLLAPRKFVSANYARIEDAAKAYLAAQEGSAAPEGAVIAVAGPVSANAIAMTNLGWRFSGAALERSLGIGRVRLINDFEAIALSLSSLGEGDLHDIGNVPPVPSQARETAAIVGAGTGLGVGGYVRDGDRFVPLVTEGGHSDFAPADDTEAEVLRILRRRFGHVSAERVLSGPGLVNLHETLALVEGRQEEPRKAQAITREALADPACFSARVLSRFCAMFGSLAGNVALVMGARKGVFVAGGIAPAIAGFLAASEFRARFESKGRFGNYMKAIPTRIVLQEYAGLLGAAASLRAAAADR